LSVKARPIILVVGRNPMNTGEICNLGTGRVRSLWMMMPMLPELVPVIARTLSRQMIANAEPSAKKNDPSAFGGDGIVLDLCSEGPRNKSTARRLTG